MENNEIIHSTIIIETEEDVGTGFIVDFEIKESKQCFFIITNPHVVKNKADDSIYEEIKVTLTVKNSYSPILHMDYVIKDVKRKIFFHNDDKCELCAIYFQEDAEKIAKNGNRFVYPPLEMGDICTEDELLSSSTISEVYVVGYPDDSIDKENNLPMVRNGVTATPMYSSYNGRNEFVVDAGVWKGNSGSPVFINLSGCCKLVGIVYYSQEPSKELNLLNCTYVKGFAQIPTGLGYVIKSFELIKLWRKVGSLLINNGGNYERKC